MHKRRLCLVLLLTLLCLPAWAQQPLAVAVERVGFTVADMDRSVDFFSRVLSFEMVSDEETDKVSAARLMGVFGARMRIVRMRLGQEEIELTQFLAPTGRPIPPDMKSNDLAFQHIAIIVSDMERAYEHLRKHGVRHASTGPQEIPAWNKGAAGIRAFYFRDPDGHFLEILSFPPGKGQPRWQDKSRLFLGIDHTAIVVSDTEASLRFYRDVLGMTVAGDGENYGSEQEHLNNVFGARLHITSVRAAKGPAIEFLEYLAPSDGRPAPVDSRSNDLWSWRTTLSVTDSATAWSATRVAKTKFVSPGFVPYLTGEALLLHDPDRHGILLQAPQK